MAKRVFVEAARRGDGLHGEGARRGQPSNPLGRASWSGSPLAPLLLSLLRCTAPRSAPKLRMMKQDYVGWRQLLSGASLASLEA